MYLVEKNSGMCTDINMLETEPPGNNDQSDACLYQEISEIGIIDTEYEVVHDRNGQSSYAGCTITRHYEVEESESDLNHRYEVINDKC